MSDLLSRTYLKNIPTRVASDFLVSARLAEEAVPAVLRPRRNEAEWEKRRNPSGDGQFSPSLRHSSSTHLLVQSRRRSLAGRKLSHRASGIIFNIGSNIFFGREVLASYTLTESIGNAAAGTEATTSSYFEQLFYFLLGAAAVLAVLKIVMGGLKYIGAAGNPSTITDAKDDIYWAVFGLILALSSYLILNTINPNLLTLDFTVTQ